MIDRSWQRREAHAGEGSRSPLGSAEAILERLYVEHVRMVKRICRRLLRNPVDAEDAAQQTFLSAYRSLLGGNRPQHAASWLATIARNECGARAQARMREPLATDEPGGTTPDAFVEAARHQELNALRDAISDLPPSQQEAFVLRELLGLSQAEISKRLTVSEGALEALLVRARRRLRERLEPVFQPLQGILPLSFALRHFVARLFHSGASPGPVLDTGSTPIAAKIAVLAVGVAAIATGSAPEPREPDATRSIPPGAAEVADGDVASDRQLAALSLGADEPARVDDRPARREHVSDTSPPAASPSSHKHGIGAAASNPPANAAPSDGTAAGPAPNEADEGEPASESLPPEDEQGSGTEESWEDLGDEEEGEGESEAEDGREEAAVGSYARESDAEDDTDESESPSGEQAEDDSESGHEEPPEGENDSGEEPDGADGLEF